MPRRLPSRVVVERVRPEIDAGRFPIKRTVGESVAVTAWAHADGHDVLAVVLQFRRVDGDGTPAWHERPMQPLGNDEWTATFDIERQAPYQYTVTAWIDGFGSWRKAVHAKVQAQQDVASDLLEGAALVRAAARRARAKRDVDAAQWLDGSSPRHGRQ